MGYYTLGFVLPASLAHSSARGDILAKVDESTSEMTWQAQYEAFGKRPEEEGANPDRQRANSKDEDPTGLLNEGFRYRDLDTGTFITRDPARFVNGPNQYTYVKQNPWTRFDPVGLRTDKEGFGWTDKDHHVVPVDIGSNYWSDSSAKKVLDDARIATPNGHNYRAHGRATGYSGHVEAELQQFMKDRGIDSIAGQSARKQKALAEAFVNQIENSSNKFIRGFNAVVGKGSDVVEAWFLKSGQHLPMPSKIGKLEQKATGILGFGKKIPVVKWAVGVALAVPTYQSHRAEGMSAAEAAAGTVVDTVNPAPISVSELGGMITSANKSLSNWIDNTQANMIDDRFPASGDYLDPQIRDMVQEMQDGLKLDPSRGR